MSDIASLKLVSFPGPRTSQAREQAWEVLGPGNKTSLKHTTTVKRLIVDCMSVIGTQYNRPLYKVSRSQIISFPIVLGPPKRGQHLSESGQLSTKDKTPEFILSSNGVLIIEVPLYYHVLLLSTPGISVSTLSSAFTVIDSTCIIAWAPRSSPRSVTASYPFQCLPPYTAVTLCMGNAHSYSNY